MARVSEASIEGSFSGGSSDQPSQSELSEIRPSTKCTILIVLNGLMFLGAYLVLTREYQSAQRLPETFKDIEWGILISGVVALVARSILDRLREFLLGRRAKSPEPSDKDLPWIVEHQEDALAFFVFVYTGLTLVALWSLVTSTGGGIHSPFSPLLAAPAIFGPFFSKYRLVIFGLVIIDAYLIYRAFGGGTTHVNGPKTPVLSQRAYTLVEFGLLFGAGVLNITRIERSEPSRTGRYLAQLGRDLRSLFAGAR
jgi:hypothetical protein